MNAPSPAENAATEARQAIAALTSALRSGEPMTPQLERASHKGLLAIPALLAQAEAGALAEGREGMVTAYDHEGRYVGCIGSETWRWLIDHPEVDAPALIRAHEMFSERAFDQQKARADRAEADRDAAVREAEQGQAPLAHLILDATTIRQAHKIARAALTGEGTG